MGFQNGRAALKKELVIAALIKEQVSGEALDTRE